MLLNDNRRICKLTHHSLLRKIPTKTSNTQHQKYKNHSQKSWNKRTAASKKPLKL